MLKVNNLVYVTNNGGYDNDNTIKVIDSNTDGIVLQLRQENNPNSIQKDKDGISCGLSPVVIVATIPSVLLSMTLIVLSLS